MWGSGGGGDDDFDDEISMVVFGYNSVGCIMLYKIIFISLIYLVGAQKVVSSVSPPCSLGNKCLTHLIMHSSDLATQVSPYCSKLIT